MPVHASACNSGWLLIVPDWAMYSRVLGGYKSYESEIPEPGVELPISLREPDQTAAMNVDSGLTCVL